MLSRGEGKKIGDKYFSNSGKRGKIAQKGLPSTGGPNLLRRDEDDGLPLLLSCPLKYEGFKRETPPNEEAAAAKEPPDDLEPRAMLLAPDIPAPIRDILPVFKDTTPKPKLVKMACLQIGSKPLDLERKLLCSL